MKHQYNEELKRKQLAIQKQSQSNLVKEMLDNDQQQYLEAFEFGKQKKAKISESEI